LAEETDEALAATFGASALGRSAATLSSGARGLKVITPDELFVPAEVVLAAASAPGLKMWVEPEAPRSLEPLPGRAV
jgi:hypothetical protein